jgi:hypothetical protein
MCGKDKECQRSISFVDGDTFYICESHCMIEIFNAIIASSDIHGNVVESTGFEPSKRYVHNPVTGTDYEIKTREGNSEIKGLWSKK